MRDDEITSPVQVKKKAIDITPYRHGIYCTVGGGEPFVNTIVSRRWSEDGSQIVFMLDTHNFHFAGPDEEFEVVERTTPFYNLEFEARCLRNDEERMKLRPTSLTHGRWPDRGGT